MFASTILDKEPFFHGNYDYLVRICEIMWRDQLYQFIEMNKIVLNPRFNEK